MIKSSNLKHHDTVHSQKSVDGDTVQKWNNQTRVAVVLAIEVQNMAYRSQIDVKSSQVKPHVLDTTEIQDGSEIQHYMMRVRCKLFLLFRPCMNSSDEIVFGNECERR
jgi:hypothetical protein